MKMFVFEGTPEEIGQVARKLQGKDSLSDLSLNPEGEKAKSSQHSKASGPADKFVTLEFARRVVTRIPLSESMKSVLRALAEKHPNWVASQALYEAAGYNVSQFSGLMGAFGRRMANTSGYDEDAHFFDYEWDGENDAWKYRLPDTVVEALRQEEIC